MCQLDSTLTRESRKPLENTRKLVNNGRIRNNGTFRAADEGGGREIWSGLKSGNTILEKGVATINSVSLAKN